MKLFFNAVFYSMRKPQERFSAIITDDRGVIIEGLQRTPVNFQGEAFDLGGSFVFPGFIDTHTHSFEGGLYTHGADLGDCFDFEEIFSCLKNVQPIDNTVLGYNLDENRLKEKRFPSLKELSTVFPDQPCIIRRIDGHSVQINDAAKTIIEKWGNIPLPPAEPYRGNWNDYICHWFHKTISQEWILKAYNEASRLAVKNGHTTIHTMIGDAKDDPLHYEILNEMKHTFSVEYLLYPQILDVPASLKLGADRIGGCILADGSFGSRTAALSKPYVNGKNQKGSLYKRDQEWEDFIIEAHNAGLQIGVHCIGDAAIKQVLNAYVKAHKHHSSAVRHQIIHAELITDQEVIELLSQFRIATVMQPAFDSLWGGADGFYASLIGSERALSCNRFRSLCSAGVLVTGSSDWYVTELSALKGIEAAVNHHNRAERLEPYQAVELYTKNAALLTGDENRFGTLEAGKQADLVVLGDNPLESEEIGAIPIRQVFKKGKPV